MKDEIVFYIIIGWLFVFWIIFFCLIFGIIEPTLKFFVAMFFGSWLLMALAERIINSENLKRSKSNENIWN